MESGQIKFYKLGDFYTVNTQQGLVTTEILFNSTLLFLVLSKHICSYLVKIFMYLFTLSLIKLKVKDTMIYLWFVSQALQRFPAAVDIKVSVFTP